MDTTFVKDVRARFGLSDFFVEILKNQGFDYSFSAKYLEDMASLEEVEQHIRDNWQEYEYLSSYFTGEPSKFRLKPGHKLVFKEIGSYAKAQIPIHSIDLKDSNNEDEMYEKSEIIVEEVHYEDVTAMEDIKYEPTSSPTLQRRGKKEVSDENLKVRLQKTLENLFMKPPYFMEQWQVAEIEYELPYFGKRSAYIKCPVHGCSLTIGAWMRYKPNGNFAQFSLNNLSRHMKRKHQGVNFREKVED